MLTGSVAAVGSSLLLGSVPLLDGCVWATSGAPGVTPPPIFPKGLKIADSLRDHASAHGLLTGFAVAPQKLRTEPAYAALVRKQASLIVAENAMKWEALRPSPTTYNFEDADALLSFAEQGRMKIRGHNLLWHRGIPRWFTAMATKENARYLLEAHIETVAGRYQGRMHSWDVVNEAIEIGDGKTGAGRPDGLRDSLWLRLIGDDYIEVAFRAARRADPQALLTYNEYGIEAEGTHDEAKRQAVLLMLRRLRARRVPIDALGVQSHIVAGGKVRYGEGLRRFLSNVRDLDLQIFITEMDVNDRDLGPDIRVRDVAVAAAYRDYLDVVLSEPAVTALVLWGVSDRDTWLNYEAGRSDGMAERPLLFDARFKAKQSFFAVRDAVDGRLKRKV